MTVVQAGRLPSRCQFEGCPNPAVAAVIVHPRAKRHGVLAAPACADHLGAAAEEVTRLFLLAAGIVEPECERERDCVALLREHVL